MTPFDFLNALWQYKPEDQYILVWTGADKRSRWFLKVEDAAEYAANAIGDVYTGVGLAGKDYGPFNRCPSDEITAIAGIGGDFDILSEAHSGKALPQTIEQALQIHEAVFTPTFTILTGNGIQSWWLLREPYVFDNAEDRQAVARTLGRWHTVLKVNAAKQGWAYERLADLARLLRVPGTKNCKNPAQSKPVTLHSQGGSLYNMADFVELLDLAKVPDADAQERTAKEWKEKFADTPIVVNLEARVSQETLDLWMGKELLDEKDATRFRHTWNRERHDLFDNSNSGYDMALIHFGLDINLTEQQIVDLVVTHRAHHGVKQKLDAGYFRRSIIKARASREEKMRRPGLAASGIGPTTPNGHPDLKGAGALDGPPVTPFAVAGDAQPVNGAAPRTISPAVAAARAKVPSQEDFAKDAMCEKLSAILGIPILHMVCIDGEEETFHMHTASHGIIVFRTAELITFRQFEIKVAGRTRRIPNQLKPKEWVAVKQDLLSACEIKPVPDEERFEGRARRDVLNYLAETEFIQSLEGQTIQDQARPMIYGGQIVVTSTNLAEYLERTKNRKTSPHEAASALVALGAEKTPRLRTSPYGRQVRWALPLPDEKRDGFDPKIIKPGLAEDQGTPTTEVIQ